MIQKDPSRRNFIKTMGLLAGTAYLPGHSFATPISKTNLHKILCCNIRVALDTDEEKGFGWNTRKEICIQIIKNHEPDILCLQEVLKVQNEDLKRAFPTFSSHGFEGPEMDRHTEGYHGIAKNPIFFSHLRYELLSAGGFWLSETPLVAGSLSWNSARARHVNWVRLRDRNTGKDFRVLNLHLDHKSKEAKVEQIKMVLNEAEQYPTHYPQILTGDFNSHVATDVYQATIDADWKDTYTDIHGAGEHGATVHTFHGENDPKKHLRKKIDFILYKGAVATKTAHIIKDHMNGIYPSDHYFLSSEVELK